MPSVLIVEDNFLESKSLEELFLSHGYTIAGVTVTGEAAVSLADSRHPDVLVVDVSLPGRVDGIEAAILIRSEHSCGLVFLTGHYDQETLTRMNAVAPDDILPKPMTELGLMQAVEGALARRKIVHH